MLSRAEIIKYLKSGKLSFDPRIKPEQVDQVSVDLHLGTKFTIFKDPPNYLPAIHVDPSLWDSDLWENRDGNTFRLAPNQRVLAQTLERIQIPNDLVGFVEGRSSWARVGVTIHVTAPKLDPGFNATITLEMVNFGKVAVDLRAGIDKPAQVMFFKLSSPLKRAELYGASAKDVFQYQSGPIPRRQAARAEPAPRR